MSCSRDAEIVSLPAPVTAVDPREVLGDLSGGRVDVDRIENLAAAPRIGCSEELLGRVNAARERLAAIAPTKDLAGDILAPMAEKGLVQVHLSLTTLDRGLARASDPDRGMDTGSSGSLERRPLPRHRHRDSLRPRPVLLAAGLCRQHDAELERLRRGSDCRRGRADTGAQGRGGAHPRRAARRRNDPSGCRRWAHCSRRAVLPRCNGTSNDHRCEGDSKFLHFVPSF